MYILLEINNLVKILWTKIWHTSILLILFEISKDAQTFTNYYLLLLLYSCSSILILLVCAYPPGLSETTLLSLCIVISRPVPQPDVFLLPMQSGGALTSLTKIIFGLLISVSFLNQNNCSLFLYPLFVFNCILLFFFYFFFILVRACN
jgi:hypothetical protein